MATKRLTQLLDLSPLFWVALFLITQSWWVWALAGCFYVGGFVGSLERLED